MILPGILWTMNLKPRLEEYPGRLLRVFLKSSDTPLVEKKDQAFLLFAPKICRNL